jgi:hypothetical protein
MRIKHDKDIQTAVDKRQGHAITHLTAVHACAVEYADESGVSETAMEAFDAGVVNGLALAVAYDRASETAPRNSIGIYAATQETNDGNDYLYFIGTKKDILAKLESVPATE